MAECDRHVAKVAGADGATIWYEHEHGSAWDEFLKAADRPDYRNPFMATPVKGEAAEGYSQ